VIFEPEGTDVVVNLDVGDGEIVPVSIPAELWLAVCRAAEEDQTTAAAVLEQGMFDCAFDDIVQGDPLGEPE